MQMIMFFVGSDASGGTHITRTTTTQRGAKGRRSGAGAESRQAQIVMLSERAERMGLPGRVIEIDRPQHRAGPMRVSAMTSAAASTSPAPSHLEEEDAERWDGLY